MNPYSHLSDDYYLNLNLTTEMALPNGREPVLHYFEQVQKKYPQMRNFSTRDKDSYLLEEDKDRGDYSWASVEPRRLCSGQVNPATPEEALTQHRHLLELAPYALSLSPLDCEALDVFMGFDFSYRGNQNQLLAETLGVSPALEKLAGIPGSKLIHHEPSITIALDEDCRLQCRVGFESRTTEYQIRSGEYPDDQLSVYVTARHYGSLEAGVTYVEMLDRLWQVCQDVVDNYAAEEVLQPLSRAISLGN
ncbi:MAG: hypothetical protein RH917_12800 [Lacipirellulaceae bacterium]